MPASREALDRFLLDLPRPLDALEDAALVAFWRVGAKGRRQAVTADRAGQGASGYEARRYRVLTRLAELGLARSEGVVWWLTKRGWTAAELAAEEAGITVWSLSDEDVRMAFR